jgi:hypothetical protein
VDAAALAGGQELTKFSTAIATRRANAAAWVKAVTYENADIVPGTPAEWNAAWDSCTDDGHLAVTSPPSSALSTPTWPAGGASECISFASDGRRMRVRLPQQVVDTSFANVIGVDSMETNASAEVRLAAGNDSAGVLPFAVYVAEVDFTTACLRTGAGNFPSGLGYPYTVCDESSVTGNYGALDVSVWGNSTVSASCTNGDPGQTRMEFNIAEGVDHLLDSWASGDPFYDDQAQCPAGNTPNQLWTRTGVSSGALNDGLVDGANYDGVDYDARLVRGDNPKAPARSGGPNLDDVGLWEYLDPNLRSAPAGSSPTAVPASCDPRTFDPSWTPTTVLSPPLQPLASIEWTLSQRLANGKNFIPGNESRLHLEACFRHYVAGGYTTQLFTDELAESPRMSWTPILEGTPPNGASTIKTILGFKPVYINTLFASCNTSRCGTVWEPGEPHTFARSNGVTNNAYTSVGAYQFRIDMLPEVIRNSNPTYGGAFTDVELVR